MIYLGPPSGEEGRGEEVIYLGPPSGEEGREGDISGVTFR